MIVSIVWEIKIEVVTPDQACHCTRQYWNLTCKWLIEFKQPWQFPTFNKPGLFLPICSCQVCLESSRGWFSTTCCGLIHQRQRWLKLNKWVILGGFGFTPSQLIPPWTGAFSCGLGFLSVSFADCVFCFTPVWVFHTPLWVFPSHVYNWDFH